MNARTVSSLFALLLVSAAAEVRAQESVSIRDINAIPRDNIQELTRGAEALTERDVRELLRSPFEGRRVSVFAVVMSDPKNSGSAAVVGGRATRVHFFVRDVAAADEGPAGMGLHVIDDQWEEHGVIDLEVGDVVGITGIISKSQFGLYLDPASVERVGRFDELDLPARLLDPVTDVSLDLVNLELGEGMFQANWTAVPELNSNLVCIDETMVVRDTNGRPDARPLWAISSSGRSRVYVSDLSHRFRNDTNETYPPGFNARSTRFVAPREGSTISICGFVVLQAFNDPDGVARPLASSTGSMLSLVPMEDSDLKVLEVPPRFDDISRPEAVLSSSQAFPVSANITADPARSIVRVRLHYNIGGQMSTKGMIGLPDSRWSISIPATRTDKAFVEYWVSAVDSRGAEARSEIYVYRILDSGIKSVRDIQETPGGRVGASPFDGLDVALDLRGSIQSDPAQSGLYVFQDDSLARPWSGVLLDAASVNPFGLQQGDGLVIRRGRISENDGNTILSVLAADRVDTGIGPLAPVVVSTAELSSPSLAEAHEGMIVRLEGASLLNQVDDTTWTVWNGSVLDAVRLSTESPGVSGQDLDLWQTRPFMDGVWIHRGNHWVLVAESDADLGNVVNVSVESELPTVPSSARLESTYPNPFDDRADVIFFLNESGKARIEVFDVSGRAIDVLANGHFPQGTSRVTLDASRLAPGPYIIRLASGSGFDTGTVIRVD